MATVPREGVRRLTNKLLTTLTAAFLFLLQPPCASADSLNFAVSEFAPYVFEQNGRITGMHIEIVIAACRALGIHPRFEAMPWKRALVYVEEGRVDALLSPVKTPKRLAFMFYSAEPLFIEKTVLFARQDKNIKVTRLDDLMGRSIGVIRGYAYSPEFDSHEGLIKEDVTDAKQLMMKLDSGLTDLVIGDEGNLKYIRKKYGLADIKIVFTVTETPDYIGFSKKALGQKGAELADRFGQVLRQMKENGVIPQIKDKYLEAPK